MAKRYQIDYGHDGDPVREAIRKLDGNIEDLYEEVDKLGVSTETPESIKEKYESNPDTNAYTDAEKVKLAGVEDGAQANAVSSVAGKTGAVALTKADVGLGNADDTSDEDKPVSAAAQAALNGKVDKAAGMGLSQESYTSAEKAKLAGLENAHFRGEFPNLGALTAVAGNTGDYAYVDLGPGEDVVTYIWDTTDGAWVPQTGSSGSETPASVKSKYEANPDTNAYSDAEKTKLAGIEAGAQVNEIGQAELNGKVDKVPGMGLSQESYTSEEKTKLATLENPDLSAYQPKSEKGQPGGYAELDEDGKVPSERLNLPNAHTLQQIDLQLPGKFAGALTNAALAAAKDFAVWELESATVKYIKVRCAAADSGATPCSVQLVVNSVAVGTPVQAVASAWTIQAQSGVTIQTGDQLEIAVVTTGTNKDSEWLRFTLVAEV